MFAALSHFFKGSGSVGIMFEEALPIGEHGTQVPDAMVALTATCVSKTIWRLFFHLLILASSFRLPSSKLLRVAPHHSASRRIGSSTSTTSTLLSLLRSARMVP